MIVNGTSILLYSQGHAIAYQKSLNLTLNDALIDATNKESDHWAESISGLRDATINFTALYATEYLTDSPAILSARDVMDYILNRDDILMIIPDLDYPILGTVNMSSLSFTAPVEGAMELSGSFKIDGALYCLIDEAVQMITDPDAGGTDYDTLTVSGLAITSAINAAGTAYVQSNTLDIVDGGKYKLATFLTKNSGQLPSVALYDNTSADISNVVTLVGGLNFITLTATATDSSSSLKFRNTDAADWSVSSLYLFKI